VMDEGEERVGLLSLCLAIAMVLLVQGELFMGLLQQRWRLISGVQEARGHAMV